jgi:hypothetical protein
VHTVTLGSSIRETLEKSWQKEETALGRFYQQQVLS